MYKDNKILAIIPARGGSKGIPKKNIRFMNGNPLIAYIVKTSISSRYIDKTIVTTDDEEISNLSYLYGVDSVISRPSKLSDDNITLDPVIYHAYKKYLEQENENFDVIITLQPTSPLLSTQSLDNAIEKMIDNNSSTMISAVPVRHLFWEKKGNKLEPYHAKRLNRQQLNPVYFEAGSFVISKTENITENTRISEPIDVFELSEIEGIDIDNYLDWTIAEKILSRKKILIRVDGNNEIGLGHIYNTLILANNLMLHDITFVMNQKSQLGVQKIAQNNYLIIEIEKDEDFFKIIERENPDIVILDVLDTEEEFMKKIKSSNCFIVSIEELGAGLKHADVVFNAIYEYESSRSRDNVYSGYPYVCLRDEFFILPFKIIDEEVKNILITFGGVDQNDLTHQCLNVFEKINKPEIKLTIITGFGYQNKEKLLLKIANMEEKGFKIDFLQDVKFISRHMHEADIVITSNGRTVFEIASLGVPSISISQNERETHHTFAQQAEGVIYLGLSDENTENTIYGAVEDLISNFAQRKRMNLSLSKYDTLNGIKRVIRIIFDKYEEKFSSNLLNT